MAHASPFSASGVCQPHSCLESSTRLCIKALQVISLPDRDLSNFKHRCRKSLELLPRVSSPGSHYREQREIVTPANSHNQSSGGNVLNEACVVATGSLC